MSLDVQESLQSKLGPTLVDFSKDGIYPEEEAVAAAYVHKSALSLALQFLGDAKAELEEEIRHISQETAPNVDSWIVHAKAIQNDIETSKRLASSIVRQAEADEEREEGLQEQEAYVDFLTKEVSFNDQLLTALNGIQGVNESLQQAEELAIQKKIIDALHALEGAWTGISNIPLEKTTRAVRLLDKKCFDLRAQIHDQFLIVWKNLVYVDPTTSTITINKSTVGEATTIEQAIIGLKAYRELEKAAKQFWEDLDNTIIRPRTDLGSRSLLKIRIKENSISSLDNESADHTIKSLFLDLEDIVRFLVNHLPADFIEPLSKFMMPVLSSRILETWLDTAVPPSLDDMVDYQKALAQVSDFATKLDSVKWPGVDNLHDWVANSPRIWLSKRREDALDWTRNQLSLGLGSPQIAERVEKRMVAREEGQHIASTGQTAVTQDWDAAWDSDGEDKLEESPNRNRRSLDEERRAQQIFTPEATQDDDPIDDAADAWGWGDDDVEEAEPISEALEESAPIEPRISPDTREMTLTEKYWTSSLPQPVFKTVAGIFDDGAQLSKPESSYIPVTPAAPGLFALPTLILAMYRALSPFYYTAEPGGNMYLYNDSIWLSEKLRQFVLEWKERPDLSPRTYNMVRLDPEIKMLESFGKRAYTHELNAQRTIINDLLAGAQNFFQQEGQLPGELENSIHAVISHIRETAALWDSILPYSAWASATGSLVNTIATKLITDVFDLTDIGVDEAERTATLISIVEELDDLFLPKPNPSDFPAPQKRNGTPDPSEDQIPMTAQFAPQWMKMKFLSEVLQSNLKDVKYLWFESDLSYYFTVDEVIELIGLSFEKNVAVRAAIREIRENPDPRGG